MQKRPPLYQTHTTGIQEKSPRPAPTHPLAPTLPSPCHRKPTNPLKHQALIPRLPHANPVGRLDAAVSSDIVGYSPIELEAGFNLVSCTFKATNGTLNLDNFISGDFEEGDQVMFFNGSGQGYTTYAYSTVRYELVDGKYVETGAGWANLIGDVVSREITPGDSFWFWAKTAKTITISGAVQATAQTIKTSESGFNLVSCAFPVDVKLNDLTFEGIDEGVQLMIFNGAGKGYTTYAYSTVRYELVDGKYVETGAGWATLIGDVVDVTIPANTPFWVFTTGTALTVTIPSPVAAQ